MLDTGMVRQLKREQAEFYAQQEAEKKRTLAEQHEKLDGLTQKIEDLKQAQVVEVNTCGSLDPEIEKLKRANAQMTTNPAEERADVMKDKSKPSSSNPKDLIGFRKPPIALCPPTLWLYASLAMKLGAKKYGPYNWRKESVGAMTYINALMRHTLSYLDGQNLDDESKTKHLAHAAACIGILLDAEANDRLIDDRPEPGKFAELVKLFTEKAPDSI